MQEAKTVRGSAPANFASLDHASRIELGSLKAWGCVDAETGERFVFHRMGRGTYDANRGGMDRALVETEVIGNS